MADKQINFTKKALELLPMPEKGKRSYYYDSKCRGLVLCFLPSGTKSFQVYRKINNKPERITLGRFPDLTIEQARGLASDINAKIAIGENPNDTNRKNRAEMTLADLHAYYIEHHAKLHKKSFEKDQSQFIRYLKSWRQYKISTIKRPAIQKLHAQIGRDNGLYAANRLLAMLHTMFNKAIDWGFCKENPVQGIQKFKEKSRERFLQSDELPHFFKALAEEPNETARDYMLMSLLTGARKDNVLSMRWEQINFQQAIWMIPDTKNGSPHSVPLVPEAMSILSYRKTQTQSEWIFPGSGKTGHLVEPRKAWYRVLQRANLQDLRLHDLRRSLGSWQATTGANLSVISKTLAHKNISTTQIYARLSLDPVWESMNKATQAMFATMENLASEELKSK